MVESFAGLLVLFAGLFFGLFGETQLFIESSLFDVGIFVAVKLLSFSQQQLMVLLPCYQLSLFCGN
jgi:hypothetical protein